MIWGIVETVRILNNEDYLYDNKTEAFYESCNSTKWFTEKEGDKWFYVKVMGLAIVFSLYVFMDWVFFQIVRFTT